MWGEIPGEQVAEAIELVAREALAEGRWVAPPVDAVALARRLGMVVARDDVGAATRGRLVRPAGTAGQGVIFVADEPRPERRQWAVAHEIGESLAYRVFAELRLDAAEAPERSREEAANLLAGSLLLPRAWLERDGAAAEWDLLELKGRYTTASHEMIARRMLAMRPAVVMTVCDQGRATWRQSNVLPRAPGLTAAERDAWQAAHRTGASVRCERGELPEGVEDVRAWAVHEEGWKREIVRMELAEAWP
jgi:hypothetical protein